MHADVEKVAVDQSLQGRGIGRRIVTDLVGAARPAGVEVLTLDLRADNAAAALYTSLGFVEYGRLERFVAVGPARYDKLFYALDLRGAAPPTPGRAGSPQRSSGHIPQQSHGQEPEPRTRGNAHGTDAPEAGRGRPEPEPGRTRRHRRGPRRRQGRLRKRPGPLDLMGFGIGIVIGTGIFTLTGVEAELHAGPAIVFSFLVAGVVSVLAAPCYAELASAVPTAGSAYTYAYATLDEPIAWIIGWAILEFALGASVVARGWSGVPR